MFLDVQVGNLIEPMNGRQWSHSEIAHQVMARVARYQRNGLTAGDRIFMHFGNRLEFFTDLLAIWRLGACAIPIDNRLTAFEVQAIARTAKPAFSIIDDAIDSPIIDAITGASVKVINTLEIDQDQTVAGHGYGSVVRMDDDALILFTSGSTGEPKGVVHTHRSLRARWITLRQSLGLEAYRRTLCLLPTHFGHGLICNCLFPWLSGQDLFITAPFQTELVMMLGKLIDEHEITFMSSVPSMWRLALKVARPPGKGSLKRVQVGSAPLSAHLWSQIQQWASTQEVFNTYGITETASWVAGTTVPDFTPEDGLIGEAWGSVIRVLETSSTEVPLTPDMECKTGESGYIWLNTPALMKGYLNREDLTNAVVCQGWFMTGDIGIIDTRGCLYLKGREREEINKGGMKIYPADIDAVTERFPSTTDVCTFGFDDELYGQNVGMAVCLKNQDSATIRELHHWLRDHLAEHKMPIRWHVLESIPRTSRGKINRTTVMQICDKLKPIDLLKILRQV